MNTLALLLALAATVPPATVPREPTLPPTPTLTPDATPRRGALPAIAAVVPGLLLHGSGHFVGGDRATARRLLVLEGAALGAMVAGIGGLAASGAARSLVAPFILTSVAGTGLFATTALADLYGVLAPAGGTGAALPFTPWLETSAGALYVKNPVLPYRWLGRAGAELRWGGWRLGPTIWGAADQQTVRAALDLARRLRGPRPERAGPPSGDGSFLDLRAGLIHHREARGPAPVDSTTAEAALEGRLELGRWAASLAGAFVEGAAGLGFTAFHYGGPVRTTEGSSLLLGRFAFGLHVGRGPAPRAEVTLGYDHRHDDFAGGTKMVGLGSGSIGHFELGTTVYLTEGWGLRALAQVGSAHVLGVSVLRRQGRVGP